MQGLEWWKDTRYTRQLATQAHPAVSKRYAVLEIADDQVKRLRMTPAAVHAVKMCDSAQAVGLSLEGLVDAMRRVAAVKLSRVVTVVSNPLPHDVLIVFMLL